MRGPLHKKVFHEAASIGALMPERQTQTLQPCKPQLAVATSLLVPAPSAKVLITPWDAACYKPRAALPDAVRNEQPVSESEGSDPTPHSSGSVHQNLCSLPGRAHSQPKIAALKLPEFFGIRLTETVNSRPRLTKRTRTLQHI